MGDLLPASRCAAGAAPGVHPGQVVRIDVRVRCARQPDVEVDRVAVAARAVLRLRGRVVADHAGQFGAVGVQQPAGGNQVALAGDEVRRTGLEHVGTGVAESGRREQRSVQVALLLVEGAGGGHRVVQEAPEVGAGLGVDVSQVRQLLDVGTQLRHLRVDVVEDHVAVADRLPELGAQAVECLGGRREREVQLDRVHLLRDRGQRLEQGVELGRHVGGVDDVRAGDTGLGRVLRTGERDVLVAEHRAGLDLGVDIGRDQIGEPRLDLEIQLRHLLAVTIEGQYIRDPADLDAVVRHLRAGVHHQARAVGDHGQAFLRRQYAAPLRVDERRHQGGQDQEDHPRQLERGSPRCVLRMRGHTATP